MVMWPTHMITDPPHHRSRVSHGHVTCDPHDHGPTSSQVQNVTWSCDPPTWSRTHLITGLECHMITDPPHHRSRVSHGHVTHLITGLVSHGHVTTHMITDLPHHRSRVSHGHVTCDPHDHRPTSSQVQSGTVRIIWDLFMCKLLKKILKWSND